MSPSVQCHCGNFSRADASMAGELSRPVRSAAGQRCATTEALFPGPQPRSMTRAGAASSTRSARSIAGCVRSRANLRYWSLFQLGIANLSHAAHAAPNPGHQRKKNDRDDADGDRLLPEELIE